MKDLGQSTEALIKTLSEDLAKVSVMPHPLRRGAPWIGVAIFYVAFVVFVFGIRADFSQKLFDPNYVFELILLFSISLSAALCACWLCIPDLRGQKWMIAVPLSLFFVFVVWAVLHISLETHGAVHLQAWHFCYGHSLVFGLIPASALLLLSLRGKTTHPYILSVMIALAVGAIGYVGLRISCVSDDIGHLCQYHILPYIVFGAILGFIGRRIYRW